MSDPTRILIVEDLKTDFELARREIRKSVKDSIFLQVETGGDFLNALETFQPDVILSDYSLPRFDGMKALKLALEHAPTTPFIVWTGSLSEDVAVECMKAGAANYILKENIKRLGPAVVHAMEERRMLLERNLAELRYRALFDQSHDAIFILDLEGRHLAANRRAAEMLGYSPEELAGLSVKEISAEQGQSKMMRERLIGGELIPAYERLFRKKDGSLVPVEINVELVRDEQGNPMHIQSIVRDITGRKQAEVEIRQRNDDLALLNAINEAVIRGESLDAVVELLAKEMKRIFSSVGSSIFMLDPGGESITMRQFSMSPAFTRQIEQLIGSAIPLVRIPILEGGYFQKALRSSEGLIINDPTGIQKWIGEFTETDFLPPAAKGPIRKLIPQIHKLLDIKSIIIIPLISDGETIGLLGISSPYLFTENDLRRIGNIGRQLTAAIQRQQANERIQRSEEFLQNAQNALSASIAILDEEGTIVRVNTAWRKFGDQNGFAHPEYGVGLNYLEICDSATGAGAEEAQEAADAIRDVIAGRRKEAQVEYPCHSPEQKRWFVLRITKFEDGKQTWVALAHEDISERAEAERQVRESEERFRVLIENGRDNISLLDRDGILLWESPATFSTLGYAMDEFKGRNIFDLIHPDDRAWTGALFQQMLQEPGSCYDGAFRLKHSNGTWRWVEATAANMLDHPSVQAVVINYRDITDRKQAERALQEAEVKYRNLVERLPVIVYTAELGVSGRWTYISPKVESLLGFTAEEWMADPELWYQQMHPDDRDRHQVVEDQARSQGGSFESEYRIFRKDGREIWIRDVGVVLPSAGGGLPIVQGTFTDVTERKLAEQALNESRARYRSLFENSPISLWEEDFSQVKAHFDQLRESGVTDFRDYFEKHPEAAAECTQKVKILDVNRATLDLLEYDDKNELGETLSASLSEDALSSIQAELTSLAEGNLFYEGEEVFYTKYGKKRDILFQLTVAPGYEETLGRVFVSIIDITERKQAEQAEREQRALAEALRDTAETLNSTLDYGEVLDHILTAAGRVVPHDTSSIMLIKDGFAFVARSQGFKKRGFDAEVMGLELPLTETTNLRQMLETKQPVVIPDTGAYPGWKKLKSTDWLRSNVGAPISISGEVIGFILLDSETPGFFTSLHAERLKAFANQAALAIQNARLLQQAQEEIVERKQAEKELRARDALLRESQKIAQLGHYDLDVAAGVWESSETLNSVFGIDENYIKDVDGWVNLVHPDQRDEMSAYFTRHVLGERNPFDREYRIVRANDRQERWVHGLGRLEFDERGNPVRMIGTIQDITERKQAENELKRSHSLLNAALEATKDGILVVGEDRRISSFNRRFLELWKIPYSLAKKMDDRALLEFVLDQLKAPAAFIAKVEELYQASEADSDDELEFKDGRIFERHSQPQRLGNAIVGRVWSFRDVTERKRADRELRESEERFRQLADNIQEMFWMTDVVNDREEYFSPAFKTIWGRPLEDMMQRKVSFLETVLPEDQPVVIPILEKQRQGEHTEMEYRIVRPDGSVRWIWDRAFPILDDSGRVVRVAGIAADITERRELESERQLLTSAIAASLNEVYLFDADTLKFMFVNNGALKNLGYTLEEALGLTPLDIKPEFTYESFQQLILPLLRHEKQLQVFETNHRRADGSLYPVEAHLQLFERDGQRVFFAVIQDITERRQAEEQLRKLSRAVEQSGSTIVITDTAGNIEYVNPKFTETTGYTAGEAIGQNPRILKSGNTPPEEYERLWATITSGEDWHGEFQNRKKNGELYWEAATISPIFNERGETTHFIAVKEDITERRQAEEENRRRGDEFAALYETARDLSAAHDLPVLLNTIVERARALLHVQGGGVYLYDPLRGDLEMVLSMNTPIPTGARLRMGEGMAGRVAQTRKPLIVDDYQAWEGRSPQYEGVPFRAVLQSPMLYGGDLIGVLVVHEMGASERKFTGTDAHLLSLFAEYAAGAVYNTRLFDETQRRAEETAALLKISQALTSLDLETNLQTIGNRAKTLFNADGCRVFLAEPGGETLRCVLALQENPGAFSDLRIKVGEGITGRVAASGQAEIVNDMIRDPRAVQVPGTPEEEEAIMFAPLKERDRTIGVISVRRVGTQRPFQPADLELLEAFASMAASAVSSARLFEETQRRLAELEALYENGLAVGQLLAPREIGERIIHTFTHRLSWHHVTIRLLKDGSDEFELVAFSQPHMREEDRDDVERNFTNRIHKAGQGMSGWVVQTGKPIRTGSVTDYPQYVDTYEGIHSGLYMPLMVGERVIGVISVESEEPDAFSAQDERLLATFANQAAIAFENARLYQSARQELAERRRAQEALRDSEAHYRELTDSITDVFFELDQDLRFTHWNKTSESLTGVAAGEAIGKTMREVLGESQEQERVGAIYKNVLQSRQPKTFETVFRLNHEYRSFEIAAYPSTRGVSVVAKDVTDRKRSETILQKRFELMEYSAHHPLDELARLVLDEICELTGSEIGFLHFMEEDQNSLGLRSCSTNSMQFFQAPASEDKHRSVDQAGVWAEAARQRRALIHNDYESLPHKTGLPEGHARIAREMVIPIIRNERIMAIIGVGNKSQGYTQQDLETASRLADYAWDITERKQMELALASERNLLAQRVEERTAELIKANSNLARALRVKDEFLANMSHELRTPLNAILGLSESLAEQIAGPLNEKQLKYITTIGESGHHLLSLINDILDLAKIEAGHITLDINKVDVNSVCQASLRMIKQLAQKKNQDVILNLDENIGLMWADERRLKQMIVNLLSNAVKFTPENGSLGLDVRGDPEENRVEFSVWDNGIGIREGDLPHLFQPFVQLDAGLDRESTGTGLGLALVSQMARLHGGSVTAASQPGKGSRFTIAIPWEPAPARDTVERLRNTGQLVPPGNDPRAKKNILLIEDTMEVVMMIKDYLETAGYEVATARDGIEGISQARLTHPDLILMDIQMPRMDGIEATRALRADPQFKYVPIIALTALAMPNDRERCIEAGMDEYVSKPVNLRALAGIIRKCLSPGEEKTRPQ